MRKKPGKYKYLVQENRRRRYFRPAVVVPER
jgi:hypothetical protein